MAVDVESVLIIGPLLLCIGSATIIFAYLARHIWAFLAEILFVGITFLLVALVIRFGWSPGRAETPFTLIGGIHLLASIPLVFLTWGGEAESATTLGIHRLWLPAHWCGQRSLPGMRGRLRTERRLSLCAAHWPRVVPPPAGACPRYSRLRQGPVPVIPGRGLSPLFPRYSL